MEWRFNHLKKKPEIKKVCKDCQQEFWCPSNKTYECCRDCANQIGHRYLGQGGYIYIKLSPEDPYYCMTVNHPMMGQGWVREARYLMAKKLGRPLTQEEVVYYLDGNKANLDINNLTCRKRLRKLDKNPTDMV